MGIRGTEWFRLFGSRKSLETIFWNLKKLKHRYYKIKFLILGESTNTFHQNCALRFPTSVLVMHYYWKKKDLHIVMFCWVSSLLSCRNQSAELTSGLTQVDRQLRTLDDKSKKFSTDLVSLKSHQQRSIESSSTLQQQIVLYEGKRHTGML